MNVAIIRVQWVAQTGCLVGSSGVLSCREDPTALALLMIANGEEQLDDLHCGSAFKLHSLKLAISRGHDCPQDNNEQY